ncbi:probable platelet-activating factor acetylhydrolase 2 [Rhynchosporium secalis]|uniref:Putative phospholipase n=1 Tax=Rhynchosporium secalis TaxID=38038 RepID=A0A1E1MML5_RHYSE|nr:probable platelet-activating factor acetylhydrolase 2 [Rhynchosporium secalis]
MASYFSRLSPVPGFPEYTGPYKVGTIDVELPISELESPSPAPEEHISTVQYRIFYPCEPEAKGKTINWIPNPQQGYVSAYTRFLGAGSVLAEVISYFPRLLYYISIPVRKNAPLLQAKTANKRWPVMVFSHGLGGSRNAYSHLVGSIASHGMIVIAPEHRDGSTPISYIRDVPSNNSITEKTSVRKSKRTIDYMKMSHTPSPEVESGRNAQLKVRLWELGTIHDSILKLDQGANLTNLNTSSTPLSPFKDMMDVHTPGKIAFAGHSFGAATVAQFVKSTFYSPRTSTAPKDYEPLFTPTSRSPLVSQITPHTPLILLDVWCLPLRAASTRWLWNLPFPCYTPSGPGGAALLAVESQAFFKWRVHLKATKRLLSPDPSSDSYDYENKTNANGTTNTAWPQPNFFYADASAHLSQSDFGVLFPWVTKRIFGSEEPERVMKLNVRAILQVLRNQDIEISKTSAEDMELEEENGVETTDDVKIIGTEGQIRGWHWINTDVQKCGDVDDTKEAGEKVEEEEVGEPTDAVIGNEILKNKSGTAQKL